MVLFSVCCGATRDNWMTTQTSRCPHSHVCHEAGIRTWPTIRRWPRVMTLMMSGRTRRPDLRHPPQSTARPLNIRRVSMPGSRAEPSRKCGPGPLPTSSTSLVSQEVSPTRDLVCPKHHCVIYGVQIRWSRKALGRRRTWIFPPQRRRMKRSCSCHGTWKAVTASVALDEVWPTDARDEEDRDCDDADDEWK